MGAICSRADEGVETRNGANGNRDNRYVAPNNHIEVAALPNPANNGPRPLELAIDPSPCLEVECAVLITPRREQQLRDSIIETPSGENAHIYQYYCPLCMEFFKDIFKGNCCGNYTCINCLTSFLKSKGIVGTTISEVLSVRDLAKISCPHCLTVGLAVEPVVRTDKVRDYSRSTGSTRMSAQSPVRVGDSFDVLKRKMLPYESSRLSERNDAAHYISSNTSSNLFIVDSGNSPPDDLSPGFNYSQLTINPEETHGVERDVHFATISTPQRVLFSDDHEEILNKNS